MIKLKNINWSGIYGFGKDNYNYNFEEGFHLITGRNGSGKSSFLNLITLALFDKSPTIGKNQAINESLNKGYINLFFYIGENQYNVIYRRESGKLEWVLKRNDKTVVTGKETGSYLSDLLGFNYEQFVNSFYLTQMSLDTLTLLYGTSSDRLRILSKVFGVNQIIEASERSREKKKDKKQIVQDLEKEQMENKGKLSGYSGLEDEIKDLTKRKKDTIMNRDSLLVKVADKFKIEEQVQSKENEIRKIRDDRDKYKERIGELKIDQNKIEDLILKDLSILEKFKEREEKSEEITSLEKEITDLKKLIDRLDIESKELAGKYSYYWSRMEELQGIIHDVDKVKEGVCDRCGSFVTGEDLEKYREKLRSEFDKNEKEGAKINKRKDEIKEKLKEEKDDLETKESKLKKINIKFNELEGITEVEVVNHVEKLKNDKQSVLSEIKVLESKVSELSAKLQKLEDDIVEEREKLKDISKIENEASALESQLKSLDERIKSNQKKVEKKKELEESVKKLNRKIEKTKKQVEGYNFWIEGFKEISILKLRMMIEGVNDKMENILSPFGLRCWLDVLEEKKGSKTHGSLDDFKRKINLFVEGGGKSKTPIEAYSGGEKQLVALALILAMGETLQNINFLAFDEVFSMVDESNRNLIMNLLENEKNEGILKGKSIFMVTHDSEIKSGLDWNQIITMEKKDGCSKIEIQN